MTEHSQIYRDFLDIGLRVKLGKPKFLGTTIQQFKLNNGKPKPGFQLWMNRIPERISNELFPILRKHSFDDYDLTASIKDEEITVTNIPDFGSLAPLMQEVGKAVFQLTRDDTSLITESQSSWGGATWKDAAKRISDFRDKFIHIEKRLDKL